MKEFVHVHNHSDYSLLRASSSIDGLVSRAQEMSMPGIALTDDGNLFGACEFYNRCTHASINPIIGCDFFLASKSRHIKSTVDNGRQYQRIVLLAKDTVGYHNLIMLSSLGYTEGFYYKPRIDKEILERYREGLIALSGGLGGEIPQLISRNRMHDAREAVDYYVQLLGRDNFYLELTDHDIPAQKQVNRALVDIAQDMGVKLVASNDSYYLRADDAYAHEVLLCIGNKYKITDPGHFKFSSEQFYLKSPEEMWALFGDYPEALKNTIEIHERCKVKLESPGLLLPHYDIPTGFNDSDGYLKHLSQEGLRRRYTEIDKELQERLNYELKTIIDMKYTGYFLIVWDFIRYARDNGIPVGPGRGSGAGSIVAYCLEITDIDPMKYGLLFERFLNPERVSMPDFDIDFCYERRQEVIDYVTAKYGKERVGQIITFGTLKPRAVIRDVARVLDFSYDEADRIAKLIPEGLKTTIESALADEAQLNELYESREECRKLIDISRKLQNLHRHASTHAAGVVIGKEALTQYVPLFRDPKTGTISTQFSMEQLEYNGLVKMDFLGLKTLTLIQNTLALIGRTEEGFDINSIPDDDQKTFELLGQGKSLAIFQFESEGMRKILAQTGPSCIEDLIALNSLYRPGPMENIGQFIDSKKGTTAIRYPHPSLESILKETYGVIVYQEQVLETVRIIAGFSLGKADILRRAMGKKKEKDMAEMRVQYMEGAIQKGVNEKVAADIFELLKPFAGYGFNKSHAAAYSVLSYKTAYLKAHFPAQFMAANLTNEIDHSDKFQDYLNEIYSMNMTVHAPDINYSEKYFVPELMHNAADAAAADGAGTDAADSAAANAAADGDASSIVYGLMGIKGLGSAVVDEIIQKRSQPYISLEDFLERVDLKTVNRRVLELLIQCGACDSLFPSRQGMLDQLNQLIKIAISRKAEKHFGQTGLFDDSPQGDYPVVTLNADSEYPLMTRLKWERELIGHYFSGHPLDEYKKEWAGGTDLDLAKIPRTKSGTDCRMVAVVAQHREILTKKGKKMLVGLLEDFRGEINFVIFSDVYEHYADIIQADAVLSFVGELDFRDGEAQLIITEARVPEKTKPQEGGYIHIRMISGGTEELMHIRNLIHNNPGMCAVFIHVTIDGKEWVIRCSSSLRAKLSLLDELNTLDPVEEAWYEHFDVRIDIAAQ